MIITMQVAASDAEIQAVCEAIRAQGAEPLVLPGEDRVAIGIPASLNSSQREHIEAALGALSGVSVITSTSRPYKLASIEFHRQKTTVHVGDVAIGPDTFTVMGGPCSVESYEQFEASAQIVKRSGSKVIRGGAFKPRTSPYSFQGLAEEGLKIMQAVGRSHGLVTISEVMSGDLVPLVAKYVDILQIGARSM